MARHCAERTGPSQHGERVNAYRPPWQEHRLQAPVLTAAALDTARRLAASPEPSARWIGKDAVRALSKAAAKKSDTTLSNSAPPERPLSKAQKETVDE